MIRNVRGMFGQPWSAEVIARIPALSFRPNLFPQRQVGWNMPDPAGKHCDDGGSATQVQQRSDVLMGTRPESNLHTCNRKIMASLGR
jgi:hypothetical protein